MVVGAQEIGLFSAESGIRMVGGMGLSWAHMLESDYRLYQLKRLLF